jgi:membrane protease subunit (stomatin/prohibitin family)
MHERAAAAAAAQDKAMRQYIQQAAGSTSTADELAKLSALRDAGSITSEEFEAGKAKILG